MDMRRMEALGWIATGLVVAWAGAWGCGAGDKGYNPALGFATGCDGDAADWFAGSCVWLDGTMCEDTYSSAESQDMKDAAVAATESTCLNRSNTSFREDPCPRDDVWAACATLTLGLVSQVRYHYDTGDGPYDVEHERGLCDGECEFFSTDGTFTPP